MYLPSKASPQQLHQARQEQARRNHQEIVETLSQQEVHQRGSMKRALFCISGNVALKNDINPFVSTALGKPNLGLGKKDVALLISYLDEQSTPDNNAGALPSLMANTQRNLLPSSIYQLVKN